MRRTIGATADNAVPSPGTLAGWGRSGVGVQGQMPATLELGFLAGKGKWGSIPHPHHLEPPISCGFPWPSAFYAECCPLG